MREEFLAVSPTLPSGLSLSPDGVISGVPQAESSGIYTFTVVSNGNSDSKTLSLTIVSVEVQTKSANLQQIKLSTTVQGQPLSRTITVTN